MQSPSPEIRRAMVELLVRSFSADEFRRLVADVDLALIAELPGEPCPPATLITQGVDLLLRHGRVDPNFFKRWIELRPAHRSEILSIAEGTHRPSSRPAVAEAATLVATPAAPPLASASSGEQNFDVWIFLAFILILVVVVLLFLALRDSAFRVECTIAAFLVGVAFVLVLLRQKIAALFALAAGLLVLYWIDRRRDRQAAIART